MQKYQFIILPIYFFMAMNLNPIQEKLKPCPPSPNCVCTIAKDNKKKMSPLPFKGNMAESKAKITQLVDSMKRTTLIKEEAQYLHFTFITSLGRFTDDVEFYFDDENQVIHFRSASRVGWSDLGANKRRMKKIGKLWQKWKE